MSMNFELKNSDRFNQFPIIDPIDPTDRLYELKSRLSYVQIPVSFRQRFRGDKKLRPELSFGLVAYRPLSQRFIYEYLNSSGEYKLRSSFNGGTFSIDNIRLGLGFEYTLWKNVSIRPEARYQRGFSLHTSQYFKLSYWAFNLGIQYKL